MLIAVIFALYCVLRLRWCIGAPCVPFVRCSAFFGRCARCFVLLPRCVPSRYALRRVIFAYVALWGVRWCSCVGVELSRDCGQNLRLSRLRSFSFSAFVAFAFGVRSGVALRPWWTPKAYPLPYYILFYAWAVLLNRTNISKWYSKSRYTMWYSGEMY